MVFSYNWLQTFFKRKLPKPEKLADLIIKHSFEVEEVRKIGEDFILDIAIQSNRGSDCFSHLGIAREIAAILNYKIQLPDSKFTEIKTAKAKDFVSVTVQNKLACPRYNARVVTDVEIGPSPKWIRERLEVCGLRPINNVVDITNYVMLETGQPLHAFDGRKLEGGKIIVRPAKRKEEITTLDDEKYELNPEILVIADIKKPIAIAGIKGGKTPEIDGRTKVLILEAANFNSKTIRHASKSIDLKTDASWRFEHGIDFNLTEIAINRAAYLIQEIAKGKVIQGLIDVYPKKPLARKVLLDLDYANRLLGFKIPQEKSKNILKGLGFGIKKTGKNKKVLNVEIPSWRLDVNIQEDLIEEIGRIYGYEKIPLIFPIAVMIPPYRNLDLFWENIAKDALKEAGFTEVYNYSFISEKDADILKYKIKDLIELENPLSSDYQYLRPSLLPNLLKNIEKNQKNFQEIRIFEMGNIFQSPKTEEKILTGMIMGDKFYEAKGVIDLLLNKLAISDIWYDEYRTPAEDAEISWWHPKKYAEIKIGQERIGFLGEISRRILDEYKISNRIVYFDIFFDKLSKLSSEEHEYRPISRFPSAVRDLAVLVPKMTKVEKVLNKIEEVGEGLIKDVDLFDIYEGENIPEEKKNLAFHIIYQAEDKTLSSEEIDNIQNKLIRSLESEPGWQVRK